MGSRSADPHSVLLGYVLRQKKIPAISNEAANTEISTGVGCVALALQLNILETIYTYSVANNDHGMSNKRGYLSQLIS
jgi:hypothetical protein